MHRTDYIVDFPIVHKLHLCHECMDVSERHILTNVGLFPITVATCIK